MLAIGSRGKNIELRIERHDKERRVRVRFDFCVYILNTLNKST